MSAPAAPIDSDLVEGSQDVLYVIEEKSVWKTANLSEAGAATWTEVWIEGALLHGTLGGLLRVRCAPGSSTLVYVLGWGEKDGTYYPFVLRSETAGMTWSEHWIDEEIETKDYSVTKVSQYYAWDAGQADFDTDPFVHTRIGDDVAGTCNPWAAAHQCTKNCTADVYIGPYGGASPYILSRSGSTADQYTPGGHYNDLLTGGDPVTAEGYMSDYFGGVEGVGWNSWADVTWNMPKESSRVEMKCHVDIMAYDPQPAGNCTINTWVFWHKPSPVMPKAFDVARTNTNWIYLGLNDKVMKSEDGGYTWAALTEDFGAYDICVDPQAAGAIYFCDPDGSVRCMVAGIDQGELTTETPTDVPLRIARDLNTGKLWVLKSGTTLAMRESGSWTDQKTGLLMGRGLHAYLGGKLIFVEGADIYISDDYGTNVTAKKGGWAEYANGMNAHRIVVPE